MKNLKKLSRILTAAILLGILGAALCLTSSAAYDVNDYWTFSAYDANGVNTANPEITEDGSVLVKDYANYNGNLSVNNSVTKMISDYPAKLNGFSVEFTALGFADYVANGVDYNDIYPESMSFIMTNKPEAYTDGAAYSINREGDAYYNDQYNMRNGFLYQDGLEGEYTLVVTLLDVCIENADGGIKYGVVGDNVYDCLNVCAIRNGVYWGEENHEIEVPATDINTLEYYVTSDSTIHIILNNDLYKFNIRLAENDTYYFGAAACSFGRGEAVGYRGSSFELKSVCGEAASTFAGYDGIAYSGECGEYAIWYIDAEETLAIRGHYEMYCYNEIGYGEGESPLHEYVDLIKWIEIDDRISYIGDNAFSGLENVEAVMIGNDSVLEEIGDGAFAGCSSLMGITFPDSLKSIGYSAFSMCPSLKTVSFGSGLEEIGTQCFWANDLKTVTIPESVKTIGDRAFATSGVSFDPDVEFLTVVIKSDDVEFGTQVFYNGEYQVRDMIAICNKDSTGDQYTAQNIYFDEIVDYGFCGEDINGDSLGTSIWWILDSSDTLHVAGKGKIDDRNIMMTDVRHEYIEYADQVKQIHIYGNVTEIGESAFYGFAALEEVKIDSKLTVIGEYAFAYTTSLSEFDTPDGVTSIGKGAFRDSLLYFIRIPTTLTSVGNWAFYSTGLTYIDTYYALTDIGTDFVDGDVEIYCTENSEAHKYALENGNNYVLTGPIISSDGPTVTLEGFDGVKDVFIAKGHYDNYTELKQNYIVLIGQKKLAGAYSYSYTLTQGSGEYTILYRMTDSTLVYKYIQIVITEPTFSQDGLQLTIGNLDGIKVVRTAYGEYTKVADIKKAAGARAFTAKYITDPDNYIVQYRENGTVTVAVCYNNGYTVIKTFEITQKTPSFSQEGNIVTFGDLNDVKVIRYAKGEYTTSSEIKKAEGSVAISGKNLTSDTLSVKLNAGTYTFCVQYNDESYNYYTVTVE